MIRNPSQRASWLTLSAPVRAALAAIPVLLLAAITLWAIAA